MSSNPYGTWLREQREAAGLTQQKLADAAIMTRSHIAHIEAGRRIPSKEDARRLDAALNTGNVLYNFLPQDDVTVSDYFETVRVLERQATSIREFAINYVPGILQTEAYARAVLSSRYPPWGEEKCDRFVATRLARASILDNPMTPRVWALLDEAVLRRPVGGPEAMADQIEHVISLAETERIRVHVLPLTLGAHPLLTGMVSIMGFDDQPPAVYMEGALVRSLENAPEVVGLVHEAYDVALSDALPSRESLAFMRMAMDEHRRHV